jgi:hypothetical protein
MKFLSSFAPFTIFALVVSSNPIAQVQAAGTNPGPPTPAQIVAVAPQLDFTAGKNPTGKHSAYWSLWQRSFEV